MKKYLMGLYLLMMPLLSIAQLPPFQTENDIRFIEGGVGLDESDAITMESKNWPLLLEFSKTNVQKSEWVSNVFLVIKDARGSQVLAHQVDGPLILIGLKPGRYSAESNYDGLKMVTNFNVENGKHKKININWK